MEQTTLFVIIRSLFEAIERGFIMLDPHLGVILLKVLVDRLTARSGLFFVELERREPVQGFLFRIMIEIALHQYWTCLLQLHEQDHMSRIMPRRRFDHGHALS